MLICPKLQDYESEFGGLIIILDGGSFSSFAFKSFKCSVRKLWEINSFWEQTLEDHVQLSYRSSFGLLEPTINCPLGSEEFLEPSSGLRRQERANGG